MMNNQNFHPITILLIEDHPCQEGIKVKDLIARGMDLGDIHPNTAVPGINFKNSDKKSLYNLFELKVLQHPEEVKEYISMSQAIEDENGSEFLGSIPGIVPEVVVFDYKLSDNFTINSKGGGNLTYFRKLRKIRELYNPNFLLIKQNRSATSNQLYLEDEKNINYTVNDFIDRINNKESIGNEAWFISDEKQLKEDELGLFAGVEITRLFRNHACIGIPATFNKKDKESLHAFSKFYEWVNEHDLGSMFSREERGEKKWDLVIPAAMIQLRTRIESLISSGKLTPRMKQLAKLSEGYIPESFEERVITLESEYGIRNYPIDGLFFDFNPSSINKAVVDWTNKLLPLVKMSEYKIASEASFYLIKAYKSSPVVKNRIRLSEIIVKLANMEDLDNSESNELDILLQEFGISIIEIDKYISEGLTENIYIQNKIADFREVRVKDNFINRLIALFTDIYLHLAWQNFCLMNENSEIETSIMTELRRRPTIEDLRLALFPIPKNPLILPYHLHLLNDKTLIKKEPFEIWDSYLDKRKMNEYALYPRSNFPNNLGNCDRQLCRSLALDIGLQQEYLPIWLKK